MKKRILSRVLLERVKTIRRFYARRMRHDYNFDVLSNLLQWIGYDVTKKYYVNDAVSQVKTLVSPVFLRYKEALEEEITIGAGLYPGELSKAHSAGFG
ncbi:hypothetical protein [Anaplasma phagocytophilum]|nr:hypothetical protein [Anaplasma phagocytophilum]